MARNSRDINYTVNVPVTVSGQEQIARLEKQLEASRAEVDSLQGSLQGAVTEVNRLIDEMERFKTVNGIDILEEELRRFKSTAEQSLMEFRSYLESVNLNDSWGNNDYMFERMFQKIKDGSMTAQQAIMQVKTDYDYLLREMSSSSSGAFDSQMVQQFSITLTRLGETIDEVLTRIQRIETEGVKAVGSVGSAGSSGGGIADISEVFNRVRESAELMSETANGSISSVANLVGALKDYAELDSAKMLGISQAFRNMADLGTGSFSTKSVENLVYLAKQISALNESGSFNFRFDISGIKDFKVSSTIHHLSDFLNSINDGQISSLERLSKINLSNFHQDNLKISKATAESLKEIIKVGQAQQQEAEAVKKTEEAYRAHEKEVEAAARAEAEKAKISDLLAKALEREKERTESAGKAANQHSQDVSRMLQIQRQIGSLGSLQEKLKVEDPKKYAEVKRQLEELGKEYALLYNRNAGSLNTSEVKKLAQAEVDAANRIRIAHEGAADSVTKLTAAQIAANQKAAQSFDTAAAEKVKALTQDYEALGTKTEEVKQKLTALNEAMRQLENAPVGTEARTQAERQYASALEAATKAVKDQAAAEKEQERLNNRRTSMLTELNSKLVQCEAAQRKYAAAAKLGVAGDSYKQLANHIREINALIEQMRKGPITADMVKEFERLKLAVSDTTTQLKTSGSIIGNWATTGMQQLRSRLSYTFGLAAMVYKAVAEVKKMITVATELDTAMNKLQIVTSSSGAEMDTYAKRVSAMAKETAQATKDLIDATTVYARLGYSMDKSAALAKYTAMLQGVGDIEAGAAQDAMTAILKAFDKDVSDVEEVMNKMVVVGNNFPISVSQIAEGMNNAGSMLAVAGNDLDQSIALLTAANTTVQDVSKASTGLRTIAARIRKTVTEEDGDEAINEAKYEEMLGILTQHKVTLTTINGEYRSTYDIIKDIAGVWEDLTSMEKAAVTEALAGTRQQNVFSSLITQFQEADNAMRSMAYSSGELEEAYDIYLGSIEAHAKTLKAAFDELSMDFVNSSFAKYVLDFLTKIIESLDFLIDKIGVIGTLIAGAGIVLLVKNFGLIKDAILSVVAAQEAMIASGGMAWLAGGVTLGSLIPILLGVAAAVAAIVIAVKNYNNEHPSLESLRKEAQGAAKEVEETKNKIDSLSSSIKTNEKRIEELHEIRSQGDWTDQLQEELNKLNEENEALQVQLELEQKIAEYRKKAAVEKTNTAVDAWNNTPQNRTVKMNIGGTSYTVTEDSKSGLGGLQNTIEDYEAHEQRIKEIREEISSLPDELSGADVERSEALRKELSSEEEAAGDALQILHDYYNELSEYENALWYADDNDVKSAENLKLVSDAIDLITESTGIGDKGIEKFKRNLDRLSSDTLKKVISGLDDLTEDELKEFDSWMKKCGYTIDDVANSLYEYTSGLKETAEATSDLDTGKTIGDLTSLQDELAATTKALEEYKKAMEGGEKGDAVKEMADIYKGAMEDMLSGRIDSNRVHAAAEMFFSQEQLAAMNYDMAEIGKELQNSMLQALFDPEGESKQSYGQRFAKYIEENASKFANAGAAVEATADGFRFHYDSLKLLADAFGISQEACAAFLDDLDAYGVEVMRSTEENTQLAQEFLKIRNNATSAKDAVVTFIKQMAAAGRDSMEIRSILTDLSNNGVIDLNADEINSVLADTMDELNNIDKEKASPEINADTSNAISKFRNVEDWVRHLNSLKATVQVEAKDSTGSIRSYENDTSRLGGRASRAEGGVTGRAGPTLVNELGPELISDKGRAFIANGGMPGFVNLSKNAIVFSAKETDEILKNGALPSGAGAYAGGTRKGLIGRLLGGTGVPAKAASSWVCPVCGSRNDKSATVCWKCKTPKSSAVSSTPSTSSSRWSCNHCGFANPQSAVKCQNCGKMRGTVPDRITNSSYQSAQPESTISLSGGSYWKCANCGRTNSTSVKYCASCGKYRFSSNKTNIPGNYSAYQGVNYDDAYSYGDSGGGAGDGGAGGADSQSKSNPQKIDWIAVRLNRIQRAVQDLEKVASSGLKNLSTRLGATRDEVSKLNQEIDTSQRGYERYIQEAESVGLRPDLVEKVRNGTIDINEYDDEELRQQISEYQEWYEKALDCASAVEELNQQIGELYRTNFDLVQADYENQLSLIEHEMTMINADISMSQAKGMLESAEYYELLATKETQSINKMKAELSDLEKYFSQAMKSGKIAENSEEWYAMKQEILGVKEAIAQANVQLQEYSNTVRDIEWSHFDYAQERFGELSSEANFLIELLSNSKLFDDRGQFSSSGYATLGMRAVNYDAYMSQADSYAKELLKIESEIMHDPYNKDLISRRTTLLSLQRQSITAAEQEKVAVRSLVQEGIQIELDSLRELIDAYKESLDSSKDLYEYQKKITEKTQSIASIQKQLAAYQGDTSEETRSRVQKLNNDLKKAQEDLAETEREQSISDQKKILDDVYSEYEELVNARLDNLDLLMKEMIDAANANTEKINNELFATANQVGYIITEEMQTAMNGHYANYDRIFDGISGATSVLNHIYENVNAMARAAGAVKAYAKGGLVDYTGLAAVHGTPGNPELVLSAADTEKFLQAAQMMQVVNGVTSIPSKDIGALTTYGTGGMNIGGITMDISIDHVQDYNDFVRQLQADPKFERLIDTMTMGRMLGESRLAKNGIRF